MPKAQHQGPSHNHTSLIPGAAWVGPEARPAAAIVKSPMCARTGLPLLTGV